MDSQNETILIDTGYFVALGNVNDRHHKKAVDFLPIIANLQWITTWPVLTETCHLLQRENKSVDLFLKSFEEGAFEIFVLTQEHLPQIRTLMHKYKNLPMDLADASLVVLAEKLGHGKIVTTDHRDFNSYKWKNHHPFENLLK